MDVSKLERTEKGDYKKIVSSYSLSYETRVALEDRAKREHLNVSQTLDLLLRKTLIAEAGCN